MIREQIIKEAKIESYSPEQLYRVIIQHINDHDVKRAKKIIKLMEKGSGKKKMIDSLKYLKAGTTVTDQMLQHMIQDIIYETRTVQYRYKKGVYPKATMLALKEIKSRYDQAVYIVTDSQADEDF